MPIIGVVQVKGGAGRSTIATNLAAALSEKSSTTLIDCDMPQGTAASWAAIRKEEGRLGNLEPVTASGCKALVSRVQGAKTDYVVIDAPPRIEEVTRAILMLSNLVLVPLGASAAEVWATSDLLTTLDEARQKTNDLDARIVWTRFRAYTRSAQEISQAVKKELPIPVLKTKLGFRVAYAETLARGLSVAEWSDKTAKDELKALIREIRRLLD